MNDARPRATILVADDEPDIVALASLRLTRSGFTVITAVDGQDALRVTRDRMPDLVVLDVMMPRLTGIEVSRLLRAAPETSALPVILMSAGLFNLETIPGDADAFIAKPFGSLELPNLVDQVLARESRKLKVGVQDHTPRSTKLGAGAARTPGPPRVGGGRESCSPSAWTLPPARA